MLYNEQKKIIMLKAQKDQINKIKGQQCNCLNYVVLNGLEALINEEFNLKKDSDIIIDLKCITEFLGEISSNLDQLKCRKLKLEKSLEKIREKLDPHSRLYNCDKTGDLTKDLIDKSLEWERIEENISQKEVLSSSIVEIHDEIIMAQL